MYAMLMTLWLALAKVAPKKAPRRRPACRRPLLEALEDRALPSSYSAASVSALIADINAANAAGGANTISLTAPTTSPYALTAVNNGANGLPVIAANDNLTIVGNGDTIEKSTASSRAFRLFDVAAGASLTLQNLNLQGGVVAGKGGAIYNQGALTLSGVTVRGNRATGPGGAIYNQGALTLSGVTVEGNQTSGETWGAPAAGGGIWSNGSLTLENGTLLEGNNAKGMANSFGVGGAAFGGAVYVAGGTANITNTTFTDNNVTGGLGHGDGNAFGGALYVAAGQVVLTTSTVNNNGAWGNESAGYGGGLYVLYGNVTLTNDTVESNTAGNGYGYGGGIYIASGATVYLDSFTVANTINNTDYSGLNGKTANIDGTYILQNP